MMRFMRFHRRGASLSQPVARAVAILAAGLSAGCSASLSGPNFGLFEDDKPQQTASGYGRSNLGNDSYGGGGTPYSAPRGGRDGNSVSSQNLPDASPPTSTAYSGGRTGQTYASNDRGSSPSYASPPASSPNYNSYTAGGRYGTVPPASTASTNRYDPQPAPTLANPGDTVEVQPGDTLYGIARRHNVSVAELMQLNSLTNPNLKLGQRLYLPQGVAAARSPAQPITQTASVQPPPVSANLESKYRGSYTVQPGDSPYSIARRHNVSVAELQQANGITDVRAVKAGAVLRVPPSGGGGAAQPLQQVAVAPPGASSPAPSYQTTDVPSTTQPTIINGSGTPPGSTSYTQVATRNVNNVATGGIAPTQPRQSTSDKLRWPVSGRIISGFGQRPDGTHNDGINMSVPLGTQVQAAESGTVAYAGSELKGYGNLILLRHDNGWVTAYAHNDQLMVKRGDKVQRGQVIAAAGRSGSVDQPQVHFELRQGSKPVDPVPFLERL